MGCAKCNENIPASDCGCDQESLHISQVCNPIECETNECSESFPAACSIYTGEDIICNNVVVVATGTPVDQAIANITAYFCTTSVTGVMDVMCGEDVVVTAGSTLANAVADVVSYFCNAVENIELTPGPQGIQGIQGIQGVQGIPGTAGATGATGNGIASIVWTSNSGGQPVGTQGTTDTYTITYTNASTSIFIVTNGTDGSGGSGGMGSKAVTIDMGGPVANTAAETTLIGTVIGSLDIPANTMVVGDTYHFQAAGTIDSDAGFPILQIRVKMNSTSIAETIAIPMPDNAVRGWKIDTIITVRGIGINGIIAATGEFWFHVNFTNGQHNSFSVNKITTPIDTTILNTIDLTAEWNTASPTNYIDTETVVLTKLN